MGRKMEEGGKGEGGTEGGRRRRRDGERVHNCAGTWRDQKKDLDFLLY